MKVSSFLFSVVDLCNDPSKSKDNRLQDDVCKSAVNFSNISARKFYILVHFFAVSCKTTTSIDQIIDFVKKVNTRRLIFFSLFEIESHSYNLARGQ